MDVEDKCYRHMRRWKECGCNVPVLKKYQCTRRQRTNYCRCPRKVQDLPELPWHNPDETLMGKCPECTKKAKLRKVEEHERREAKKFQKAKAVEDARAAARAWQNAEEEARLASAARDQKHGYQRSHQNQQTGFPLVQARRPLSSMNEQHFDSFNTDVGNVSLYENAPPNAFKAPDSSQRTLTSLLRLAFEPSRHQLRTNQPPRESGTRRQHPNLTRAEVTQRGREGMASSMISREDLTSNEPYKPGRASFIDRNRETRGPSIQGANRGVGIDVSFTRPPDGTIDPRNMTRNDRESITIADPLQHEELNPDWAKLYADRTAVSGWSDSRNSMFAANQTAGSESREAGWPRGASRPRVTFNTPSALAGPSRQGRPREHNCEEERDEHHNKYHKTGHNGGHRDDRGGFRK